MNLTIDEVKVVRAALNKAALSRDVVNMITKTDAYLKECGWVWEHRALPRRKYQRQTRYEYVWVQIN